MIGKILGQAVLPSEVKFTFAEKHGIVDKFVKTCNTSSIHMENQILSEVTFARGGRKDHTVPDGERFTSFMLVDRMIREVSPMYAVFGLGAAHEPDTFGSIMGEVKTPLCGNSGVADMDQKDLLHSKDTGIQQFVFDALKSGDRVLQRLFKTNNPLAEVQRGKLLQFNVAAIKKNLQESREATNDRQRK